MAKTKVTDKWYYEPRCKICTSHNREIYEDMWKKNEIPYRGLSRIAKDKFNEDISARAFGSHINKHYLLNELAERSTAKIEVEVQKTIDIINELRNSISDIESIITLAKKIFNEKPTPSALNALSNAMDRKRALLDTMDKISRELKGKRGGMSEDQLIHELVWATEGLCRKCAKKLVIRINKRVSEWKLGN